MNSKKIEKLIAQLPDLKVDVEPETRTEYAQDWTRFWPPKACAVAFPKSVDQARRLVKFAVENQLALVPSGGRTGLSGGAVAATNELVVSMERMRNILSFDPIDRSLTVQAGVVTALVQATAEKQGLIYPVSFASEGSSQIGGNVATNAGGVKVLRYGMTRDWVSGLKVITGSGEVLELNRGLVKNASGYDLRHLFIGSEGTLGLIVEATLKLTDSPPAQSVMILGLSSIDGVMQLFALARKVLRLSAFEFFTDRAAALVCEANGLPPPLETSSPIYVLLEFDNPDECYSEAALKLFEQTVDSSLVNDGVLSQSVTQARTLWRYREEISQSIAKRHPYKNDVSVRVSHVSDFLQQLEKLVKQRYPEFDVVWYGHLGDGNLHLNILKPDELDLTQFEHTCQDVNRHIFNLVREFGGSISAEHGIGLLKQPYLDYNLSNEEVRILKAMKSVFDPQQIMNPGKLIGLTHN